MRIIIIHQILVTSLLALSDSNPVVSSNKSQKMASVPFGMHAAQKVRHNMSLASTSKKQWQNDSSNAHSYPNNCMDSAPSKYCEKMMNSIWGLYNRYSVHNFKSNTSGMVPQTVQQLAINGSNDWLHNPINSSWNELVMKLSSPSFHQ